MRIESPSFVHNDKIPIDYTADGRNVNPELKISEIPSGTRSLVLILDDPDAEKVVGYTWVHWVLFNIPVDGNAVIIPEDSIVGMPGESTYKKPLYGGPNPPVGTGVHNYHFKIYAIDKELELSKIASLSEITKLIKGHILANSVLIGKYQRD